MNSTRPTGLGWTTSEVNIGTSAIVDQSLTVGIVSLQGASFYINEPSYGHGTMEEERPDQVYKTRDWEGREIGPAVAFFLSIETHRATKKKTLLSSYGEATVSFAENGREPASANECVAPPNPTIQITLELFSKKVFNEGEGYARMMVQLFKVVDGLDRGVKTMKKGEVASLTIHPEYVFGLTELHLNMAESRSTDPKAKDKGKFI
ncbi:FKBP-type peptidyl-prolyl cis-trans isomerase domain-containing protein [Tanacetum coccineum]